ncbi:hypothetical protein [Mycolicibacterium agri]|uniref:hypothetical protein n=1 Tax=Mycolicibacterium agri TaxID=36811 RepID=UPI0010559D65|nr:hypothetical protein [Mycolicibacterium agri]
MTVDRRRKQWSASITPEGDFFLSHGRFPTDAAPEHDLQTSESISGADDFATKLLAELRTWDGQLTVVSPTDRQRARYRRAIHHLITDHQVPQGFALRHTGRDRGDLVIRLIREADEPQPALTPQVVVPQSTSQVSDEVRTLGSAVRMAVTEPSMERALRILQAIAGECASRSWTLDRDPRDDRRFQISTSGCSFELGLREELVDREVPDDEKLGMAKYSWQRVPLQVKKIGSGRLTLQLGQYYRTRSWSDRSRWTLDSKLGALFAELDSRVAEAAAQRQQREADLARRQQEWDTAVLGAKQAYLVDLNRRRLHEQAAQFAQAQAQRDYAGALDGVLAGCADASAAEPIRRWQRSALDEADRIDPINNPDMLCHLEPDTISPDDYAPFMPQGMNAHRRPTQ